MTTLEGLLTVPGAAAAAVLLVQVCKLLGLPSRWLRLAAVLFAITLVELATALLDPTVASLTVGVLTGLAAGLAAIAGYDTGTSGVAYTVERKKG